MKSVSITYNNNEMIVKESDCISIFRYCKLISIVADAPYVVMETSERRKLLPVSLASMIDNLPGIFISCSKSVIVNALYVNSFNLKHREIELTTGKIYTVSVRKRNRVAEHILSAREQKENYLSDECLSCKRGYV